MRLTQTLFPILCSAALFATMSLTAQGPPAAGRGKAKGNGHPGANHPGRIQALIITGQNPHDWHATTPSMRKTLDDTEKFETRVVEEFRGSGPKF